MKFSVLRDHEILLLKQKYTNQSICKATNIDHMHDAYRTSIRKGMQTAQAYK